MEIKERKERSSQIKEDIYWNSQRKFWEIYSLEIIKNNPQELIQKKRNISKEDLLGNIDRYSPYGCQHYGGTLPLTPTQQVSSFIIQIYLILFSFIIYFFRFLL